MVKKTVPEQLGQIAKAFAGIIEEMDQMKMEKQSDELKNYNNMVLKNKNKGGKK